MFHSEAPLLMSPYRHKGLKKNPGPRLLGLKVETPLSITHLKEYSVLSGMIRSNLTHKICFRFAKGQNGARPAQT